MRAGLSRLAALAAVLALLGCGQGPGAGPASFNSSGQVASTNATQVSYYAAARFAEQVSFGPTPALIADIQSKGYAKWIDEQMAMPASQIDPSPMLPDLYKGGMDQRSHDWALSQFGHLAVSAPDQLRVRVAWSLSQFIVVSRLKLEPISILYWQNFLLRESFSQYEDFLYKVTIEPAMGRYLDNNINRPKSERCPDCAPNENYARELMQLFSIGVYKLNPNGTMVMGSNGLPIETYTQDDVEEMARALTGWSEVDKPRMFPDVMNGADHQYWDRPMEARPVSWNHDYGEKKILGQTLPANQTVEQDLRSVIKILMNHPNTAPFVSYRLIQNLVKSNPTPAYVERVAKVWNNNGGGVRGDLKAVVKAVLLDPEARQGDDFRVASATDGKLRESFLFETGLWRGLMCERFPSQEAGRANYELNQFPFGPDTVFSFYAPTDVASGTNTPAPEQKLLDAREFQSRLGYSMWMRYSAVKRDDEVTGVSSMTAAGCKLDEFYTAYDKSPSTFIDLLAARYFRGVMPAVLRVELERLYTDLQSRTWQKKQERALLLMHYALTSPYFGAMK